MKKAPSTIPVDFTCPLTREQAERIFDLGREAVIFVLIALAARVAGLNGEATSGPSGMIPAHKKPSSRKRGKRPGAKKGHPGKRRKDPPEITHEVEHPPMENCPECGSPLGEPAERRFRLIEDIPEIWPEVTRHSVPRQWCPSCRKLVEPPVPDALPGARFGHRLIVLTAWLHYGLGVSISQVVTVLNVHLHFKASCGGLVNAWQRLAELLFAWYEAIGRQVRSSGVLHADETGWRKNGTTVWLWCFTTSHATCYMIDRSRGSPALSRFFTDTFNGVLVSDFWPAYNAVVCAAHQACLPHLFRELDKVSERDRSAAWKAFAKKLRRLLRDGVRLARRRDELTPETFASRRSRLAKRLEKISRIPRNNRNVTRLQKRLRRWQDALFTFVDHLQVPSDNNHAEREIRPAVIMRKNILCNRSDTGAHVQAILMSVYRTLRLRGLDPLETIAGALREYVRTGNMPPLPDPKPSDG